MSCLSCFYLFDLDCTLPPHQVKFQVYLEYAKAVGPLLSVLICFLYGCQSAAAIGANIWLSQWTNDALGNRTQETVHMRVGVYAALGIAQGKTIESCYSLWIYHCVAYFGCVSRFIMVLRLLWATTKSI